MAANNVIDHTKFKDNKMTQLTKWLVRTDVEWMDSEICRMSSLNSSRKFVIVKKAGLYALYGTPNC